MNFSTTLDRRCPYQPSIHRFLIIPMKMTDIGKKQSVTNKFGN